MRAIGGLEPGWGLTVLRIAMGLVFAVHGYAKFAAGLGKTSAFFAKVSIPLPELMGPVIALLELIGGILLVLGWATRCRRRAGMAASWSGCCSPAESHCSSQERGSLRLTKCGRRRGSRSLG